MTNENGYIVYPIGDQYFTLEEALDAAEIASTDQFSSRRAWVEDCDTEHVIARFKDGAKVAY